MKSVLTLALVLFSCAVTVAQNTSTNDKVDIIQRIIVLASGTNSTILFEKVTIAPKKNVARLYRHKNSRVKKELAFRTKRNSPKMA